MEHFFLKEATRTGMSSARTLHLVGLNPEQAAELAHLVTKISMHKTKPDVKRRDEILSQAEAAHRIRKIEQEDTAKPHTLWKIVNDKAVQLTIPEINALKSAHLKQ